MVSSLTSKVNLYKKWKFKLIWVLVRKKMYTEIPSFYFPHFTSFLYILSLFIPCTFTCASLALPLFNHYTLVQREGKGVKLRSKHTRYDAMKMWVESSKISIFG